jgi:hypothetical protein
VNDLSIGSYVYFLAVFINLVGMYRILIKGIIESKIINIMDLISIVCWSFLGLIPFLNAMLGIVIAIALLVEFFLNIDNVEIFNFNKKEK